MILYERPRNWIRYDAAKIAGSLTAAKATVLSLKTVPFQRQWVDALQKVELKREVAGTSRIEGAEFTDRELDAALKETPQQLLTRSQRQARAALNAYTWLASVPPGAPVTVEMFLHLHGLMITGADDDHCPPGQIREQDQNVLFGSPRHRGVNGGAECAEALGDLVRAIAEEFSAHDPIVQAIAAHYHLAAMHPFLDGNGRTSRAIEALLLGRAGLRDTSFIAMSNYYYDEKTRYLSTLAATREAGHDLTPFILFALTGIAEQGQRLLTEIKRELSRALFRNMMMDLFERMESPRKRVIRQRQVKILNILLEGDQELRRLIDRTDGLYRGLKNPTRALQRDINDLFVLGTIEANRAGDTWIFSAKLDWPTLMTDTEFFKKAKGLPHSKTNIFGATE
jgi:Fic family protein